MGRASEPIEAIVGDNLRRLREARDMSQAELASAGAAMGRPWSQASVARIESGQRDATLSDLLVLAAILQANLNELLKRDAAEVNLGGAAIPVSALPSLLAQRRRLPAEVLIFVAGDGHGGRSQDRREVARLVKRYGPLSNARLSQARRAARGDVEQRAARKLGSSPLEVSIVAVKSWGRSLTEQRDAIAASMEGGDRHATLRAVTARLVTQIGNRIRK